MKLLSHESQIANIRKKIKLLFKSPMLCIPFFVLFNINCIKRQIVEDVSKKSEFRAIVNEALGYDHEIASFL